MYSEVQTTKYTTCNTISSVTQVSSGDLQIKRKYKLSRNNPDTVTKWWFVVRWVYCWNQKKSGVPLLCRLLGKMEPVNYYVDLYPKWSPTAVSSINSCLLSLWHPPLFPIPLYQALQMNPLCLSSYSVKKNEMQIAPVLQHRTWG